MGLYQNTIKRLGHKQWFANVFKHLAPHVDRFAHRITGGRRVFTDSVLPTLILVHTGAKSGKEYRTPISYIRVGESFGLAATNWGQPHHPGWSGNLLANPAATVEVEGKKIPVSARRLSEQEKTELWPKFLEIWPAYNTYRTRTDRNIRVFLLEPR